MRPEEWARLRELRLRALATDPRAFGATLDEERLLPDDAWRERAAGDATRAFFVAENAGAWVGLVGARVLDDASHELIAMWTAPEARGRGAGRALVESVVAWARDRNAPDLHLWVIDENEPARRLYERCGFIQSGEPRQGRRDPTRRYQRMDLALGSLR